MATQQLCFVGGTEVELSAKQVLEDQCQSAKTAAYDMVQSFGGGKSVAPRLGGE